MLVGVYHAIAAKLRTVSHSQTAEFLTGGRKLPIIPVCLSLLTTFISGIALLGLPAEIYQRGIGMGIGFFGGGISFLISGAFFVPVFYKLQFISVYEYLEIRYDSVILRRIGSALFLVSTLFYMAVVMYAPSVALAVGAVSTIYTAIGGIKAVIWTDTLQAGFMYVGLGTLIIKGTIDAGGFWKVIEVAEKTGRLTESINKWDPSIFQYNSFWITTFGGILHWTCFYGLNQMALQRYCSMPSLRHARIVMGLTVPAFWIIGIMCCSIGIIMIGYFHGCDPVGTGEIENMDQMSILMAGRILGILISTLSTTSSGSNSMTAVIWEDFLKQKYNGMDESKKARLMKVITCIIGIASTLLAFACDYMGGIFNAATTTLGAAAGPLVGLFFLGIFSERANKNGAFAGLAISSFLMIILSVSNNIEKPYSRYVLPLVQNASNPTCRVFNSSSSRHSEVHISSLKHHLDPHPHLLHRPDWHYGDPSTTLFARTSPFVYAAIGKG
uniref:Sodium-coupled monocarboxylate transporter 1 n=1 Tax=Panagrolaimus davidi TaxID=227884 RepID=A0A914PR44_9BILA